MHARACVEPWEPQKSQAGVALARHGASLEMLRHTQRVEGRRQGPQSLGNEGGTLMRAEAGKICATIPQVLS